MAVNTVTTSNQIQTPESADGLQIGSATTKKVAFYGSTPITQPTASSQAAIVDASGGTAAPTNGVLALTGTYNSAIIGNALATVIAQGNAMRNALVSLGIIKGS